MGADSYLFDRPDGRDAEQMRLERQAFLFDPVTERVFRAAGIGGIVTLWPMIGAWCTV